ncbi:IS66 family insertion sequence element accessory protein TnpA [Sorangium cellulosum]|uniref:IS66 family insertion sequence element accessory protein TnpA n=1 Tax=Sorangium cellulosum TaxID=56 RepID=UPI003B8A7733
MDESRRIWRDRVARWHRSGHSARVFAEQEGISAGTLYSWSRRLGMNRSAYRRIRPANAIVMVGAAPVTCSHREGGSDGDEGGVGRAGAAMGAERVERREVRAARGLQAQAAVLVALEAAG